MTDTPPEQSRSRPLPIIVALQAVTIAALALSHFDQSRRLRQTEGWASEAARLAEEAASSAEAARARAEKAECRIKDLSDRIQGGPLAARDPFACDPLRLPSTQPPANPW